MFQLTGKIALVTGAGRGMGFGIAQALARQGATVVVNDFFIERAQETAETLRSEGLQAHAVAADMTDRQVIFAMVERVQGEIGALDVFVHNAGVPALGACLA